MGIGINSYNNKKGTQSSIHNLNFLKIAFFINDTAKENSQSFIIIPEIAMIKINEIHEKSLKFYENHKFSYNPLDSKQLISCFWSKPDEDPFWEFLKNYANDVQKEFLDYIIENNLLPESKKE